MRNDQNYTNVITKYNKWLTNGQKKALRKRADQISLQNAKTRSEAQTSAVQNLNKTNDYLSSMGLSSNLRKAPSSGVDEESRRMPEFRQQNQALKAQEQGVLDVYGRQAAAATKAARARAAAAARKGNGLYRIVDPKTGEMMKDASGNYIWTSKKNKAAVERGETVAGINDTAKNRPEFTNRQGEALAAAIASGDETRANNVLRSINAERAGRTVRVIPLNDKAMFTVASNMGASAYQGAVTAALAGKVGENVAKSITGAFSGLTTVTEDAPKGNGIADARAEQNALIKKTKAVTRASSVIQYAADVGAIPQATADIYITQVKNGTFDADKTGAYIVTQINGKALENASTNAGLMNDAVTSYVADGTPTLAQKTFFQAYTRAQQTGSMDDYTAVGEAYIEVIKEQNNSQLQVARNIVLDAIGNGLDGNTAVAAMNAFKAGDTQGFIDMVNSGVEDASLRSVNRVAMHYKDIGMITDTEMAAVTKMIDARDAQGAVDALNAGLEARFTEQLATMCEEWHTDALTNDSVYKGDDADFWHHFDACYRIAKAANTADAWAKCQDAYAQLVQAEFNGQVAQATAEANQAIKYGLSREKADAAIEAFKSGDVETYISILNETGFEDEPIGYVAAVEKDAWLTKTLGIDYATYGKYSALSDEELEGSIKQLKKHKKENADAISEAEAVLKARRIEESSEKIAGYKAMGIEALTAEMDKLEKTMKSDYEWDNGVTEYVGDAEAKENLTLMGYALNMLQQEERPRKYTETVTDAAASLRAGTDFDNIANAALADAGNVNASVRYENGRWYYTPDAASLRTGLNAGASANLNMKDRERIEAEKYEELGWTDANGSYFNAQAFKRADGKYVVMSTVTGENIPMTPAWAMKYQEKLERGIDPDGLQMGVFDTREEAEEYIETVEDIAKRNSKTGTEKEVEGYGAEALNLITLMTDPALLWASWGNGGSVVEVKYAEQIDAEERIASGEGRREGADLAYDAIKGGWSAEGNLALEKEGRRLGSDSIARAYNWYTYATEDEKKLLAYYCATDIEKAGEYLKATDTYINERLMNDLTEAAKGVSGTRVYDEDGNIVKKGNAAVAIASHAASFVTKPLDAIGGLYTLWSTVTGQEIDPYSKWFVANTWNSGVRQSQYADLQSRFDRAFGKEEGQSRIGKATVWTVQIIDSVVDSWMSAKLGQGFAAGKIGQAVSLTTMGLSAGAEVERELKQNGVPDKQAKSLGIAAMVFEAMFEVASLDKIIHGADDLTKSAASRILIGAGIEGSEEVFTEAANIAANCWTLGYASDYRKEIAEMMAGGMKYSKAAAMATLNQVLTVSIAGLGGALSGGISGTVNTMVAGADARNTGSTLRNSGATDTVATAAAASTDATVSALWNKVKAGYETHHNISDMDLGMLNYALLNSDISTLTGRVDALVTDGTITEADGEKVKNYLNGVIKAADNGLETSAYGLDADTEPLNGVSRETLNEVARDAYEKVTSDTVTVENARDVINGGVVTEKNLYGVQVVQHTEGKLTAEQKNAVAFASAMAKAGGTQIVVHDTLPVNGVMFDGALHVALDSDRGFISTVAHEMTHYLKSASNTESYNSLVSFLREQANSAKRNGFNELMAQKKAEARETFTNASEAEIAKIAEDETVATLCESMLNDETFVRELIQKDRNLFEKIYKWIGDVLKNFRDMMAKNKSVRGTREAERLVQDMEEARDLWYKCLQEAKNASGEEGDTRFSKKDGEHERLYKEFRQYEYSKPVIIDGDTEYVSLTFPKQAVYADTVREVYNALNTNTDKDREAIADKTFKLASEFMIRFRQDIDAAGATKEGEKASEVAYGYYKLSTVRYNEKVLNNNYSTKELTNGRISDILLHEAIHSVTVYALGIYKHGDKYGLLLDYQKDACKTLNEVYEEIKKDPSFKGQYGLTDVYEMVSEMADPEFVELLKAEPKKKFLERIVDAIRRLLGIRTETRYDRVNKALLDLIVATDSKDVERADDAFYIYGKSGINDIDYRYVRDSEHKNATRFSKKDSIEQYDPVVTSYENQASDYERLAEIERDEADTANGLMDKNAEREHSKKASEYYELAKKNRDAAEARKKSIANLWDSWNKRYEYLPPEEKNRLIQYEYTNYLSRAGLDYEEAKRYAQEYFAEPVEQESVATPAETETAGEGLKTTQETETEQDVSEPARNVVENANELPEETKAVEDTEQKPVASDTKETAQPVQESSVNGAVTGRTVGNNIPVYQVAKNKAASVPNMTSAEGTRAESETRNEPVRNAFGVTAEEYEEDMRYEREKNEAKVEQQKVINNPKEQTEQKPLAAPKPGEQKKETIIDSLRNKIRVTRPQGSGMRTNIMTPDADTPDLNTARALISDIQNEDGTVTPSEDIEAVARSVSKVPKFGMLDPARMLDKLAKGNQDLRNRLKVLLENPFNEAGKKFAKQLVSRRTSFDKEMNRIGITTKELSAAVQKYGEGGYENEYGEWVPYTDADLEREFPSMAKNIKEAADVCRNIYDDYIDDMNSMLETIYPNVIEHMVADTNRLEQYIKDSETKVSNQQALVSEIEATLKKQYAELDEMRLENAKALLEKYQQKLVARNMQKQQLEDALRSGEDIRGRRVLRRSDYFRHFTENEDGFGRLKAILGGDSEIDPMLAGKTAETRPKSKWAGFMQKRTGNKTTLDAIKGMHLYMMEAERKLAFDPFSAYLEDIENAIRKEGKNIKENAGAGMEHTEDLTRWLKAWRNEILGKSNELDRAFSDSGVVGRKAIEAFKWINGRVKSDSVLGNLKSAVVQISNLTNAASYVRNPADWANAARMWIAQKTGDETANGVLDESGFMTQRYGLDFKEYDEKWSPKQFALWMLGAGDEAAGKLMWYAAYSQYMRNPAAANRNGNRNYRNAIEYADDITRRSTAGRGIGEQPTLMTSQFLNVLAPFQLEVNNTWQNLKEMVGKNAAGRIVAFELTTAILNGALKAVTGNKPLPFDLIDAVIQTLKYAFKDDEDDEDKTNEEKVKETLKFFAQNFGGSLVNGLPFASQVFGTILGEDGSDALFGEDYSPTMYGTGNIGASAVREGVGDIIDIVKNGIAGKYDDANKWITAFIDNSEWMKILLPWGGAQAQRSLKAFNMLRNGYSSKLNSDGEEVAQFGYEHSFFGDLKALTMGKWSTEEGQAYLEGGKALSVEETANMKEAMKTGMSPVDFFKSLAELKAVTGEKDADGKTAVTKSSAQFSALAESDMTDAQMQLMLDSLGKTNAMRDRYNADDSGIGVSTFLSYAADYGDKTDLAEDESQTTAFLKRVADDGNLTDAQKIAMTQIVLGSNSKNAVAKMSAASAAGVSISNLVKYDKMAADKDGKLQALMDDTTMNASEKSALYKVLYPDGKERDFTNQALFELSGRSDEMVARGKVAIANGVPGEKVNEYYTIKGEKDTDPETGASTSIGKEAVLTQLFEDTSLTSEQKDVLATALYPNGKKRDWSSRSMFELSGMTDNEYSKAQVAISNGVPATKALEYLKVTKETKYDALTGHTSKIGKDAVLERVMADKHMTPKQKLAVEVMLYPTDTKRRDYTNADWFYLSSTSSGTEGKAYKCAKQAVEAGIPLSACVAETKEYLRMKAAGEGSGKNGGMTQKDTKKICYRLGLTDRQAAIMFKIYK